MRRGSLAAFAGFTALTVTLGIGCGGSNRGAKGPSVEGGLPRMVVSAMREEAQGAPARAAGLWLEALDAAVAAPDDPWQIAVEEAALDALVIRSIASFSDVGEDDGLVYRMQDGSFEGLPPAGSIAGRLAAAATRASDPFSAGLIARALHELATHRGDVESAERWHSAMGCARRRRWWDR